MPAKHLVLFACLAFSAQVGVATAGEGPLRMLFVGNSYTYENNLPFVFERLADPIRDVEVAMLAEGGATLRRHLDGDRLLPMIRDGKFDVIVAQEQSLLGPGRLLDGLSRVGDPAEFHRAVREIAAACRAAGSRLVLFATWPRAESPANLAALHNAYARIGREVEADVAPVGLAWDRLGGDSCEALRLYGEDGSHPAGEGTYVAAVVLIRSILGEMPALAPVHRVPLMDGSAKPSGAHADITPSKEGLAVMQKAMSAVFDPASGEHLALLPEVPPIPEPALPPASARGRISPAFLRGVWRGEFATFEPDLIAEATIDLRAEPATIRLVHPEPGWPEQDDDAAATLRGPDADGVVALGYPSKAKNCTVEFRLVRVGRRLSGVVRFVLEGGREWVSSSVSFSREPARD